MPAFRSRQGRNQPPRDPNSGSWGIKEFFLPSDSRGRAAGPIGRAEERRFQEAQKETPFPARVEQESVFPWSIPMGRLRGHKNGGVAGELSQLGRPEGSPTETAAFGPRVSPVGEQPASQKVVYAGEAGAQPAGTGASDVKKVMSELLGKDSRSENLKTGPEDELSTDDGGFDWGKLLAVVAPTLIGAAVGGKYGAAIGARAGTEFLTGQKTEREAKFTSAVNLALQAGTPDGLRKLSKQKIKGMRSLQMVLGGVADAVEAKTDTKRRDRIVKLGKGGYFQSAMLEAAKIGDLSLLADLEAMQSSYEVEKMQSMAKDESALREEYMKDAKNYTSMRDAYGRLKATATGTAAGDLSLIFAYMKILDPTSVVRESEFANAANSGSAWNRVGALWNKVRTGARLTDAQRKNFMAEAENLYKAQIGIHETRKKTYTQIAQAYKYDVSRVVIDFGGELSTPKEHVDLSTVSDDEFMKIYGYHNADPNLKQQWGDYKQMMMARRGDKTYWT